MVSADMPHGEAREGSVEEMEARQDLTAEQKRKVLHDNAAFFYGIDL